MGYDSATYRLAGETMNLRESIEHAEKQFNNLDQRLTGTSLHLENIEKSINELSKLLAEEIALQKELIELQKGSAKESPVKAEPAKEEPIKSEPIKEEPAKEVAEKATPKKEYSDMQKLAHSINQSVKDSPNLSLNHKNELVPDVYARAVEKNGNEHVEVYSRSQKIKVDLMEVKGKPAARYADFNINKSGEARQESEAPKSGWINKPTDMENLPEEIQAAVSSFKGFDEKEKEAPKKNKETPERE